jgi:CBS domain-containing protein
MRDLHHLRIGANLNTRRHDGGKIDMQVDRIATMGADSIRPDATIHEAAERMALAEIGFLPVEDNGQLVGVLTDRDIVTKAVAKRLDPRFTPIFEVMSTNPAWLYEDAEVVDAARLMEQRGVRRLVVLDHDKRLFGVLSLDDIVCEAPDEASMSHVHSVLRKHTTSERVLQLMSSAPSEL